MKIIYPILLMIIGFSFANLSAQNECEGAKNITYLHANNVRTPIDASGSIFWDSHGNEYEVTIDNNSYPNTTTIFAHGLWLSALDPSGNLKTSIASLGKNGGQYDYYPGPVVEGGINSAESCQNWDKVWSVNRFEIETHIADWEDNNVIDNPIPSIFSWPGQGNPNFEEWNNFELPETPQGFAPFRDLNGDGIYNPLTGDYPVVQQSAIIPEQITWTVFNDLGPHDESGGEPLNMEIQLTSWAYNCSSDPLYNSATFCSYKLINKGVESLDELYIGMYTDFDLGCFSDDYVGSAPEQNTHFAYNGDPVDDVDCSPGSDGFGENPPVQAVTFLNQSLDNYIYLSNPTLGDPHSGTLDPITPQQFRFWLQGLFYDGTPISEGGDGYNTSDIILNHAFPGNPNNSNEWSMETTDVFWGDRSAVGSHFVPTLAPGATYELDLAFTLHREEMGNALSNVNVMYEGINTIQSYYDNTFAESCNASTLCVNDCIWPGDLNADGIANHCDLINLGFNLGDTGSTRAGPYHWTPNNGIDWVNSQFDGTNSKHLDADGNGIANTDDFLLTRSHYRFTRPDYEPNDVYNEGDDLILSAPMPLQDIHDISPGSSTFIRIELAESIPNLKAIAFSIEYDPVYFEYLAHSNMVTFDDDKIEFTHGEKPGQFDFALFHLDDPSTFDPLLVGLIFLKARTSFDEPLPSYQTSLRFKNVKAYLDDGTFIQLGGNTLDATFNNLPVSTPEIGWSEEINIFPNPTLDKIFIDQGNLQVLSINVLDVAGKLVHQYSAAAEQLQEIDLSAYANGIYFIQIRTKQGITTKKIMKQ